jgi:hypothetical protein
VYLSFCAYKCKGINQKTTGIVEKGAAKRQKEIRGQKGSRSGMGRGEE